MFDNPREEIVVFVLCVFILILFLSVFLIMLVYKHQKKGIAYSREIEDLRVKYENTLLQSQLEVQEQTFQHIAREIHDNIGQKLTLAKLYLNTLSYSSLEEVRLSVSESLDLITDSISSLSDVSRSMGTEVLLNNGLVKGIELELNKLQKTGLYQCDFKVNGQEIFLNANTEIVIFRIVQECINNFLKHAKGRCESIYLHYTADELELIIRDDGQGFEANSSSPGAGLINIKKRAAMLNGFCNIDSCGTGTTITIKIPINESTKQAIPNISR
jgi:two-component system, NarL family, sensor kinase